MSSVCLFLVESLKRLRAEELSNFRKQIKKIESWGNHCPKKNKCKQQNLILLRITSGCFATL